MIDAKQLAREMAYTMSKVKLATETALLKRMLESGDIDQVTHDKIRAECNEKFIAALELAAKTVLTKDTK